MTDNEINVILNRSKKIVKESQKSFEASIARMKENQKEIKKLFS